MKIIIVIISLLVTSLTFFQNKEQIKIYLKLELDSLCFKKQKYYNNNEKGLVFIDKSKESFLFSDTSKADTLCTSTLKKYKTSSIDEIKKIETKWREQKFKEVQKKLKETGKYPLPIHTFDKNYIFDTYILEIISNEKFVLYPVKWRGQGIQK